MTELPAWMLQLMPIGPELLVVGGALFLLLLGAYAGQRAAGLVHFLGVLVLLTAAAGILFCAQLPHGLLLNQMVLVDGFSQAIKVLVLLASALALFAARGWLIQGPGGKAFELPVLVMIATVGLMLMVSSSDFMSLYVALELSSLSLYVLASFQRDSLISSEAGVKYFVLGALASGLLLFGISLLYGYTGTTNFGGMAQLLETNQLATPEALTAPYLGVAFGLVLVLIGLCFKVSAVPFHMWTPDVYHGAPTPVTAFFATAPKVAATALIARVCLDAFGPLHWQWQSILLIMAAGSLLIGAWGAITQSNIKRLLAYSSIGHVGFLLLALAIGNVDSIKALVVYLALYAATGIGAFAVLIAVSGPEKSAEELADVAGLSTRHPWLAGLLAAFLFSMAGIPPLAGFYAKMLVLQSSMQAGFIGISLLAVASSVVACFYYLKVVKVMYFDSAEQEENMAVENIALGGCTGRQLKLVLLVSAVVTLGYFLYPSKLILWAHAAASALVQ